MSLAWDHKKADAGRGGSVLKEDRRILREMNEKDMNTMEIFKSDKFPNRTYRAIES
ncbi:MAG: hypothetical protein QMD13_05970 [Candidatus Bathyarchaeia archaeon]|nr:hypothetical protein [Candidatus Bathyarchaeia archaeon]